MLASPFSLPTVRARRHSLFTSLPWYFSDTSPSDSKAPKLSPNHSTWHQSHQAVQEKTLCVGLPTLPAAGGLALQVNFVHVINPSFGARVEICLFVTSGLNTSKSNYLLPFVTSQLPAKPSPGDVFSQPGRHPALSAAACQRPAFSPLTLLLKHTSSQFAILHLLKLPTRFVPCVSVFTLSSQ